METTRTPRPPLVTCFGGGGAFGVGFNVGVAHGLRERGIDVARWPMLGTSAGSHAAATLDNELGFEHVAELWERYIDAQTRRFGVNGHELAGSIYGGHDATDVATVAVRLLTLRRHVLSADDHPLADIVAASSAVVPVARAHRIDGRRYVDGGLISIASADLAPAGDLLLLVTPFARPDQGIPGRIGGWQARREIRKWTDRHGGDVLHVVASAEMAQLGGTHVDDIGDMRIGRAVYPMAVELGRHVADVLGRDVPQLVDAAPVPAVG